MKTILKSLVAFAIILTVTGCGSSGGDEDKLIIYSNAVSEGRGDWIKAQATEAGFDLEFVDLGGGAIVDRLLSEKNNQIADIVIGLNQMGFEKLRAADVLEKFEPEWAGLIPNGYINSSGLYYPFEQIAILQIFNQSVFTPETAPKSWEDMIARDEFNGKYFVDSKLTGGTIQVLISSILSDHRDTNGELGIAQEGWDKIESYFNNGYLSVDGDNFQGLLASGDVPITRMWSNGMITLENDFEQEFGVVKPENGVPFVVEQVGLIKGTDKQDKAIEFINWFGSVDVRKAYAIEFGSVPVIPEAQNPDDERMTQILSGITQKPLDWEFVTNNIDKWVEKIELELRD